MAIPRSSNRRPLRWPQAALAQARLAHQFLWTVALPAQATIRLRQGGSLTGRLVRLSPAALTLAVGRQSQTVSLSNVADIVFSRPGDLWITLPSGARQRLRQIRGWTVPLPGVPAQALQVHHSAETAGVDLTSPLTAAQFTRLSQNPRIMHVLQSIEVSPDGAMALRARPYRLE